MSWQSSGATALNKIIKHLLVLIVSLISIDAAPRFDIDGDGKADPVIIRYTRVGINDLIYWYAPKSNGNGYFAEQWGYNPIDERADFFFPADYDGDGKTDLAVFRTAYLQNPIPTYFYVLPSSNQTPQIMQWGLSDDYAIPQDYDGDGKTDIAVFRREPIPNGITWYMMQSRDGYQVFNIQSVGDPIRGDYDGDGRADFAWTWFDKENRKYFYIVKSSTMQLEVTQFGIVPDDAAVPGDYDGDGKTDIAVWRGIGEHFTGRWYWLRSRDGRMDSVRFGTGTTVGDYPVQDDYDGDGKTDPAIFRNFNNTLNPAQPAYFYILGSQRGYYADQWGLTSDQSPLVFPLF